jgi:alcohol dehydrogenase (cytochrome c)
MRNRKLVVLISTTVVVMGVVGATGFYWQLYDWKAVVGLKSKSDAKIWEQLSCRAQLYLRKARGSSAELSQLSWMELWGLTRPGIPFHCSEGASLEASLHYSPYASTGDRLAGAGIFQERCIGCHGSDGSGGPHGPSLIRSNYDYGDSDMAIYKILKNGVPGTAMPPAGLPPAKALLVIAYVKALQARLPPDSDDKPPPRPAIDVSNERLLAAGSRTDEWLMYSSAYNGQRYTPLDQITPANVAKLRVRWIRQFPGDDSASEATPLVIDGVIFTAISASHVAALDAKTGEVIWNYRPPVPNGLSLCCGGPNRGLAAYGNTLFFDSLDGYLIALNASDGKVEWQTRVARSSDGYTLTGAPLVVDHSVVVGVAGGEFGVRGFLAAFDVSTGQEQWKFYTIPGPGEFGHDTWSGDSWRTGGGPTWNTGSYDPSTGLLYWGVGNPSPNFNGNQRTGDNLFTDSVIALHANTGKLAWYFQFTPHDVRDWDSAQNPVLADLPIDGEIRKVICWANRNGFYYVLDRVTGKFLAGAPFVKQTWAEGLSPTGRPILSHDVQVSDAGHSTTPGVQGGTNWQGPAFDKNRGSFFVPATDSTTVITELPLGEVATREPGKRFDGSSWSAMTPPKPSVIALDAATGRQKWKYKITRTPDAIDNSSLLATGGGLVFGASGGTIFALDSDSGREVWCLSLGGGTRSGLVSFTVDGQQVILVMAGQDLLLLGL